MLCQQAYKAGIRSDTYSWVYVGGISGAEWYLKDLPAVHCSEDQLRLAFDGHFSLDYAHVAAAESLRLPTNKVHLSPLLRFSMYLDLTRCNYCVDCW